MRPQWIGEKPLQLLPFSGILFNASGTRLQAFGLSPDGEGRASLLVDPSGLQYTAPLPGQAEMSTPVENSPKFRSKIPQPSPGGGLQFRLADGTQSPAGKAEASSAGEQLAKE
jgi:hypothetical protein